MNYRNRYANALSSYRSAEFATYGTRISGKEFAARVKDEVEGLEVVTVVGDCECVTERDPTPSEWATAAESVTYIYRDSYVVRNRLFPDADYQREVSSFRAGISL